MTQRVPSGGWSLFLTLNAALCMSEEVAILCIGTGEYTRLLPGLLRSVRQYFLPGRSKRFYVFTDGEAESAPDVQRVERAHRGWPVDTLERYGMFTEIAGELKRHRYIYFFNANMRPVAPIGREVLPTAERPLVVVQHPRCFTPEELAAATEQRPGSMAHIPTLPYTYVAGGFNGGTTEAFLTMAAELHRRQLADAVAGLMPPWHDESYLNAYRVQHEELFRVLSPAYLYPEGWRGDYPARIICLDKKRYFGRKG